MKKLVIFDLDGTLLNTISDLGNACNHALEQMGFSPHPLSAYNYMVGNGVRKLIERALPAEARNDESIVKRMLAEFRAYYDEHLCDATTPYRGIPELLNELTARGINLAVTSNKYESAVQRLIKHFFPSANFRAVLGHVDGLPAKPDPSIVFKALGLCPTPKADTIYIGDSGVDMETARRACIESAGVSWGFRSVLELRQAYANHIVSTPDQILDLIIDSGKI